ncbi:MAG: DUF4301 family protein [Muribaculaceae bacterium]|nr:DUF4301 family protein [Muribaculaceae bacterium]
MLTPQDLNQIKSKGITAEMIDAQLKRFETGFPILKIHAVATPGHGIVRLDDKGVSQCLKSWNEFRRGDGTIEKFVPASGAASRMFKDLFAFINSGRMTPETPFEKKFFEEVSHFAFFPLLNKACVKRWNKDVNELVADERHADVVRALLESDGLNYGALPKALLKFHRAAGISPHTPVEEHLEEGAQYAATSDRRVKLHFTVSPEHRREFEKLLAAKLPLLEKVWGVTYEVTMSEQKPSTDTIAVNTDNTPYRESDGSLLFRPAGHGALLENLNERDADVVFVKNIDNVVPLSLRYETVRYKKVIAGYLIDIQRQIADYLTLLDSGKATPEQLQAMLAWVEDKLSTHAPEALEGDALVDYLRRKLNRPIRVCGVVRNEGEPGGGPYLAYNADGTYSPQILEAAQIDSSDPAAVELMNSGTHFNPVDLVCYIKDYKGKKFDLKQFVDPDTGLISMKSKGGVDIKALELPGLWNGSMSDWNTIFVEVPIETFNPVKTVNDLLRKQHQA